MAAFVVDHQRLVFLRHELNSLADDLEDLGIDGVELGVDLQTDDAVADVPERGRTVLRQRLAAELHVGEQQHAVATLDVGIAALDGQVLQAAVLNAEKPSAAAAFSSSGGTGRPSAFSRSAKSAAPSLSISSKGPNFQL